MFWSKYFVFSSYLSTRREHCPFLMNPVFFSCVCGRGSNKFCGLFRMKFHSGGKKVWVSFRITTFASFWIFLLHRSFINVRLFAKSTCAFYRNVVDAAWKMISNETIVLFLLGCFILFADYSENWQLQNILANFIKREERFTGENNSTSSSCLLGFWFLPHDSRS